MSLSLCLPAKTPFLLRNRVGFGFYGNPSWMGARRSIRFQFTASIAERRWSRDLSWGEVAPIEYNGWDVEESDFEMQRNGVNAFPVFVAAASIAGVFGLIAWFFVPGKVFGPKARPDSSTHEISVSCNEEVSVHVVHADDSGVVSEPAEATAIDERLEPKQGGIFVSFTVDSAQHESFSSLKKLNIIEEDAQAEDLCTRREYARWLVRTNSLLERRRKHRISTCAALSGSSVIAFDDVGRRDPDFEFIQSFAEVGVVASKLFVTSGPEDEACMHFFPDRFLSRKDLVIWRAKLEYEPSVENRVEMSRMNTGFLDMKEASSAELLLDLHADENGIIRCVFGHCKRFQPHKPCTKAQAAAALTSGRMRDFIRAEIARLEAETLSQQNEKKEIMSELLEKGDIKNYWERKIHEERIRGMEVEVEHRSARTTAEQEKSFLQSSLLELVKQKASLDCQKELVSSLRQEVMEMSEKLSLERAECIDQGLGTQDERRDVEAKLEKLHDTKSILETEVEAVRILRSWVEDEARKNQARAKVLEAATQRWKWDG